MTLPPKPEPTTITSVSVGEGAARCPGVGEVDDDDDMVWLSGLMSMMWVTVLPVQKRTYPTVSLVLSGTLTLIGRTTIVGCAFPAASGEPDQQTDSDEQNSGAENPHQFRSGDGKRSPATGALLVG